MKRLLVPLIFALTIPISVKAEVDPKIHKLCLPAADYAGCIKAQTTKSTDIPSLRVIQGKTELSGNSCPRGFAYNGAGKCAKVEVQNTGPNIAAFSIKNILGKNMIEPIGLWMSGLAEKPKVSFAYLGEVTNAIYDPKCPDVEPFLYTNSSCANKPPIPEASEIKHLFKGIHLGNRKKLVEDWDNALEDFYGVKGLATEARYGKNHSLKKEAYSGSVKINCDSPVWKNKPKCK